MGVNGMLRVGITRNLLGEDGIGSSIEHLERVEGVVYEFLPNWSPILDAEWADGFDALIVEDTEVHRRSIDGLDQLVVIARFGAGYDSVDLEACTEAGVIVTNAPEGVQRPMATAYLCLLLAVSLRLTEKEQLLRGGLWQEAKRCHGIGVRGRNLGVIGLGNIGSELLRIARPLQMRYLVYDPWIRESDGATLGAEVVSLENVLQDSDFLCLTARLTNETRGLIGEPELRQMKPSAYLINAARGGLVDYKALHRALSGGWISGAALDVFDPEPIGPDDPLLAMPNVLCTPHALGITDESIDLTAASVAQTLAEISSGHFPRHAVNPAVADRQSLKAKLRRVATAGR